MKDLKTYEDCKIWWDEELSVVRAVGAGDLTQSAAEWFLEETQYFADTYGDSLGWLLDMREINTVGSGARRVWAKTTAHPSLRKYALFGASTYIRVVANFIATAVGNKNSRQFATEEEAIAWIQEEV